MRRILGRAGGVNMTTKLGEPEFKYAYFEMITGIDTGYLEE